MKYSNPGIVWKAWSCGMAPGVRGLAAEYENFCEICWRGVLLHDNYPMWIGYGDPWKMLNSLNSKFF